MEADAEVQGPRLQPVPPLRSRARLPSAFRVLPALLPGARLVGPDPGCRESQLV